MQAFPCPDGALVLPAVVGQPTGAIYCETDGYVPDPPVTWGLRGGQQTYGEVQRSDHCAYFIQAVGLIQAESEHAQAVVCIRLLVFGEQGQLIPARLAPLGGPETKGMGVERQTKVGFATQVARKVRITTFPKKSLVDKRLPSKVTSVAGGAG